MAYELLTEMDKKLGFAVVVVGVESPDLQVYWYT